MGVEALLLAAGDRSGAAAVWLGWLMTARRTAAGRELWKARKFNRHKEASIKEVRI